MRLDLQQEVSGTKGRAARLRRAGVGDFIFTVEEKGAARSLYPNRLSAEQRVPGGPQGANALNLTYPRRHRIGSKLLGVLAGSIWDGGQGMAREG